MHVSTQGQGMRLPETAHASRPWRIHEIAPDFRLEDVWALPTPGGPADFPRLVERFASADPSQSLPGAARALWELRWKGGGPARRRPRAGGAAVEGRGAVWLGR